MSALPLLVFTREGENLRSLSLEGDVSIGRGSDNVVRLDDRAVSRSHALVRKTSEGVQIERRSDFAPILLNGAECTRALLKEGDVVEIGPYRMRLDAKKEEERRSELRSEAKSDARSNFFAPQASPEPDASPENTFEIDSAAGAIIPAPDSELQRAEPLPTDSIAAATDGFEVEASGIAEPIFGDSVGAEEGSQDPGTDIFNRPSEGAIGEGTVEGLPSGEGGFELQLGEADAISDLALDAAFEPIDEDGATKVQIAAVSARLEIAAGRANVSELPLDKDEILIGRGKECDIVLKDKKSSRKNAVITRTGNRYRIRDLGSSNGTYLNGSKIDESELSSDDVIRIGEAEIRFIAVNTDEIDPNDYYVPSEDDIPPPDAAALMEAEPHGGALDGMMLGEELGPVGAPESFVQPEEEAPKKKGLWAIYDKYVRNFKTLKPVQKLLVVLVAGLFLSWYFEEELGLVESVPRKPAQVQKKQDPEAPTAVGYDALPADKRAQVDEAVRAATDFLRQQEFDKAIYEVQGRVYPILPDYPPAKEIERYSQEGKRRKEAIEEEMRRKEAEEQLRMRIAELEGQARALMEKRSYDEAGDLFGEILAIDPENGSVGEWKREIDAWREEQERLEQERLVQQEINRRAWDTYNEGFDLHKGGKYREAIALYRRVPELGTDDSVLLKKSQTMIKTAQESIRDLREPHLRRGKDFETDGDLGQAFKEFQKATEVDPSHPAGWEGMERIRDILTERAKILYTEAVIAESYSDFKAAHQKFNEILRMAPEGSLYHQRAQRKLQSYLNFKSEESEEPGL
jgi:pSer/pThr/pTyr-binding forkhead associated (FHA) protein/tetratricopeptide (TPR) repeat protein